MACDTTDSRYFKINGKCYFTDNHLRTYDSSQQFCKRIGGKLFEPRNKVSFDDIRKAELEIAGVTSRGTWIGITDMFDHGNYRYASNNKTLQFTNWHQSDQPDNPRHHCVTVISSYFFDDRCSTNYHLICESVK